MKESIIIGLIQNIAVLLTFAMIYENFWLKKESNSKFLAKITSGIFLGIIGVVIMYTPWTLVPGLVFDTRSVVISISGLFFGPIPTFIAIIMTSTMRIIIGGSGVWMGIAVIFSSGIIGILWRRFRSNWKEKNVYVELLSLGLTVHIVMLLCTLLLPNDKILPTLRTIIIPVFFIYTPGTLLLGLLLTRQSKNYQNRLAKEKLYETEKSLTQILKSSNIVSIIIDVNGNILFCNQYLLDLTKYNKEEVIKGNWFKIFIKPEQMDGIRKILPKDVESNDFLERYENCILDKDKQEHIISWHNARLVNAKNRFIGYTCIGVNITDQRRYEQELKNQIQKFTELNSEYLKQNEELIIAKDKAEESDRLKSAFLANLSHEIRTPMNAIMGFTELLANPRIEEEKRDIFINIVRNSGNHLLSIINDIVEISKIEAKQINLNYNTIDINKFVEELYNTIKVTIPYDKNIEFKLLKINTNNNTQITVDEVKLRQILINLLNNAIKFTENGFITLGYEIIENKQANFIVEDTGIGIEQKYHKLIFDRFRQVDNDISRIKGGSGLGLAISKAYLELMGGTIDIKSEVGRGSKFSFTIPISFTAENNENCEVNSFIAPEISVKKGKCILIAEDDNVNYLYLTELLSVYNYQILRAKTGKEAIEIVHTNSNIQLVLMDIKMPEINGYKALSEIRKINPNIPVIAQTAYALSEDIKQLKEAMFDDYVTKPINREELIRKMERILKEKVQIN